MGQLTVSNNFGTWPAATAGQPLGADALWLKVQGTPEPGDEFKPAGWNRPRDIGRLPVDEVLDSYRGAIGLVDAGRGEPGLRTPQLGAVHAVLGYWTTNRRTPATVVMPTGTGKTETMVALLVAARLPRLMVLVPSDALREQVAAKFATLGVLQELGIVRNTAHRPVVGRLRHGFRTATEARSFAEACNVVLVTPNALRHCEEKARAVLLGSCSHLFIDEAHHVAATSWAEVRAAFEDKEVVQFTATPFREDGRPLAGRMIYAFPLREAQAQGYFSEIAYTSVIDFADVDRAVSEQSVARLRADLAKGYDHVLMARVRSISRSKEVLEHYRALAPDLRPITIDSRMGQRDQDAALTALRARDSKIIVCVNMLGEGFDLPALKVAAIHDPQKSLGVTLQFVGRFARTSTNAAYGTASAFVARTELEVDRRLRELYAEDADWNLILRDLSQAAVQEQQDASDFEEGSRVFRKRSTFGVSCRR
ncbi:DEAD/DEAH box helicase [Kribbella sp. NPDC059898]|uniref:DEAD/DEAH box helicase n=1 Tax=Kribbella sp. NPDC059898 TaxID=3346995 RepID=UPI00365C2968